MKRLVIISSLLLTFSLITVAQKQDMAFATSCYKKGKNLMKQDSLEEAIEQFDIAGNIYKQNSLIPRYLQSLSKLSLCYAYIGDLKQTKKTLDKASSVITTSKVGFYPAIAEYNAAKAYYFLETMEYAKSIELHEKIIPVYIEEEGENSKSLAELYSNIGYAHGRIGEFDKRIEYYEKSLKITLTIADPKSNDVAISYNNLAFCYNNQGEYSKALEYYSTAMDIWKENDGEISKNVGDCYNNIGMTYLNMGDMKNSLKNLEKALEIRLKMYGENDDMISESYNNIGLYYSYTGDYKAQLLYYKKSLQIEMELFGENSIMLATNYNNLGSVYYSIGNYESAADYFKKAIGLIINKFSDEHPDLASFYTNMAACYSGLGNQDEALIYNEKSLEVAIKNYGEQSRSAGDSYHNLGVRYAKMGDMPTSTKYLEKALKIKENVLGKSHPRVAVTIINIALNYEDMGDPELALAYYNKAAKLYESAYGERNISLAETYLKTATNYYNRDVYDDALAYYQKAIIASSQEFSETEPEANPEVDELFINEMVIRMLEGKSYAQEKISNGASFKSSLNTIMVAIELADEYQKYYLEDITRQRMAKSYISLYKRGIYLANELLNETHEKEYHDIIFQLMEKSKASIMVASMNEVEAKKLSNIPDSLIAMQRDIKVDLGGYQKELFAIKKDNNATKEEIGEVTDKVFSKKKEYQELVDFLEKNYPSYHRLKYQNEFIDISQVQEKLLNRDNALIEYFFADSVLYALILTKEDQFFTSVKIPDGFDSNFKTFRKTTSDYGYIIGNPQKTYQEYSTSAHFLYKVLIPKEMEKIIATKKELIVVPDNLINHISFGALLTQENLNNKRDYKELHYLFKNHKINYAYSLRVSKKLKNNQRIASEETYLGVAPSYEHSLLAQNEELNDFPKFRDELYALTENGKEVESISSMIGDKSYTDKIGSEHFFKQNAGKYSVLHLAMHALVDDENPLYSKLIFDTTSDTLDDGYLHAYELYNMNLNADLVVLSACNTGYGKVIQGEGVMNLSRAFINAGCRSIVMSLWKADDQVTKELMVNFFKYLKEGDDKSTALQKAKLEYLENSDNAHAHPFFWANFVVVGDNSPVDMKVGRSLWSIGLIAAIPLLFGFYLIRRRNNRSTIN